MNMIVKMEDAAVVTSVPDLRFPYEFGTATEDVLELADVLMDEHLGQQALGRLLRDLVLERDALRAALDLRG